MPTLMVGLWKHAAVSELFQRSFFSFFSRDLESGFIGCCEVHGPIIAIPSPPEPNQNDILPNGRKHWHDCPELHKAVEGAAFIADYIKKEEEEKKVKSCAV